MVHDIFVCIEHKKTWHSLRASGRHAVTHKENLNELERKGIFVNMGECFESNRSNRRTYYMMCNLKMRDSTEDELSLANQYSRLRRPPNTND